MSRYVLAQTLLEAERWTESLEEFVRALDAAPHVFPDGHWLVGLIQTGYGACLTHLERFTEAEAQSLEGWRLVSEALAPDNRHVREALEQLVSLYEAWGNDAKADEFRSLLTPQAESLRSPAPSEDSSQAQK